MPEASPVVLFSLFLCPSHVLQWELGPRAWTRFKLDFLVRKHHRRCRKLCAASHSGAHDAWGSQFWWCQDCSVRSGCDRLTPALSSSPSTFLQWFHSLRIVAQGRISSGTAKGWRCYLPSTFVGRKKFFCTTVFPHQLEHFGCPQIQSRGKQDKCLFFLLTATYRARSCYPSRNCITISITLLCLHFPYSRSNPCF